jgi:2-polyprenyl-6-methoxyphenol hydroxylase-like FAD-dependent oxidoreductase
MHDVLIVGGGPVGLFLAGELGLAGLDVLVLEREPDGGSPYKRNPLGMRGLSAGSMEAFYRRGMLRSLLTASRAEHYAGGSARPAQVGHFAGMTLHADRVDSVRLPSPASEGLMTTLEAVESVLQERAVALGVEIRREAVTTVAQDGERVVANGHEARWLVGCDGGRSTVRRLTGFAFTGTEPQFTGYALHATLADDEQLRHGFNLTADGMYLRSPIPGHIGMMDFDGGAFDRSQDLTREHLQAVLRRVSGTGVTLTEVHLAASFTDRAMQATTYRRGRVLLAGDAAHIHSPLGGQGLNLGIGDAVNLGWKLAATVRGHDLLDTYTAERHPIGARVLDWSRAQVAVMRPGSHAPALQALVRDLLGTRDGTTYAYERMSGLYHGGNAPDFHLRDGRRLGELLHAGRGVLLDFTPDRRLARAAEPWRDRVVHAAGPAHDELGLSGVLVRPDGVVAWQGGDPAGLADAARRWFGGPS